MLKRKTLLLFRQMSTTVMGKRYEAIKNCLTEKFQPTRLTIVDESYKHRGHEPMRGKNAEETHFYIEIVSSVFQGKKMLERHRMVNEALAKEFEQGLHALSLKTKTPEEMEK
jgi:stress-induced morphogen